MEKTLKLGRIVFVAAVIGMLILGALAPENVFAGSKNKLEFMGFFSTPTFPLSNYEIVKCGAMILETRWTFGAYEGSKKGVLANADKVVQFLFNKLERDATDKGYNAIVGYRMQSAQSVVPYSSGKDILAGGTFYVAMYGTPVLVVKK